MRFEITTLKNTVLVRGHLGKFFASWRLGDFAFSRKAAEVWRRVEGSLASERGSFQCAVRPSERSLAAREQL